MSTSALPYPSRPARSTWLAGRARALVRGRADDPAWARPALIALLLGTAVAYLVNLTASGYGNDFYAAAVQAATKSWKALFFGSLDSSSFITVDKPPASLWVMALSAKLFGFSSLSVLAPQALEGVASVALLYAAVKRWFGAGPGLLAGLMLAITPVAALMFRFDNPDALLVCLLVAAGYCLVRALENASTRWVVAVGALVGFAFLTKMLQAFLVLPGFGLVYLVAAPTGLRRRLWQLLAGSGAIAVSAGWWVAIVALWPTGARPMIDGSPDNSILNLITGYNGLGRVFGGSGPGGGGPGPNFSGSPNLLRLFNDLMGGQAGWLLPASLLILAGGLWATRRRPRTDRLRAALLLWGGWLVVSGLVFSLSSGVIHTYYTVALAPAIAALVAIGSTVLWRRHAQRWPRVALSAAILLTAIWSWVLLDRTPAWQPWLRPVVIASGVLAVALLLSDTPRGRRVRAVCVVLGAVACLAGPFAYMLDTVATAHTGSVPSAGPTTAGSSGPTFGAAPGQTATVNAALVTTLKRAAGHYRWVAATTGSQSAASLELATGGAPVMAIGGFNNQGGNLTLSQFERYVSTGQIHYYIAAGRGFPGAGASSGAGGPVPGGLAGASGLGLAGAPPGGSGALAGGSGALAGAPPGGSGASTGGGAFPGAPGAGGGPPLGTIAGRPGLGSARSSTQAISNWVEAHFKSTTIGGEVVYDLTQPRA